MRRILLLIIITICLGFGSFSQGISISNSNSVPDNSAMLDIKSSSKGLLIPRMTGKQRLLIASPATGLMVFQTDGTSGFYYYNGSSWTQLGAGGGADTLSGWATTGNGSTDSTVNFIGTMDSKPLIGKVNNQRVLYISPNTTNTILGLQSGVNAIAQDNTLFGYKSGYSLSKGDGNIFMGQYAGYTDTTGRQNLFLGNYSGYNTTSGSYNQFVGYQAGQYNTIGIENLFTGYQAGQSNTTGSQNFFEGDYSGNSNTTGSSNHFEGYKAGASNTTGYNNHFTGFEAGFYNSTGTQNQFVGYQTGYSNTTGEFNLFDGLSAGFHNTTGNYNQYNGYAAGYSNLTGSQNLFVGLEAGTLNSTGSYNHFIGYQAGYNNLASGNHFAGYQAGYFTTFGAENQFEGYQAGFHNTSGVCNYMSGYQAGSFNTTGSTNTYIGFAAGYSGNGSGNVMIGYKAGLNETGSNKLYISNSNTSAPLIYGDFNSQVLRVNGMQEIASTSNPQFLLILSNNGTEDARIAYDNTISGQFWYTSAHEDAANKQNGFFDFSYTGFASNRVFQLLGTGNAWLAGTLTQASDARLKEAIKPLRGSLQKVMQVDGFTYKWKDKSKDSTEQIGFIAQQMEKIFPQLVKTDEKGFKSVAYTNMVPVLLESIKEQQGEIEGLRSEVEELKRLINSHPTKN